MATHYQPGNYEAEVVSHGYVKVGQKETEAIRISFVPKVDGVLGQWPREINLWLTEKAINNSLQRLRDMGFNGARFADLKNHSFTGVIVQVTCRHETRDGNTYERWDFPAPSNAYSQTIDDWPTDRLDNLYGADLQKTAGQASTPQKGGVATGGTPF